jgi:hypothetical protein
METAFMRDPKKSSFAAHYLLSDIGIVIFLELKEGRDANNRHMDVANRPRSGATAGGRRVGG